MHDCPCCGEAVYSDDEDDVCSCCEAAGCEMHDCASRCGYKGRHDVDGVYDDCQIPACVVCETRMTFCTDGKWHPNCDDPKDCERRYDLSQG